LQYSKDVNLFVNKQINYDTIAWQADFALVEF